MIREHFAQHGVGRMGGFRWRGHSHVSRIEGFTDAVFAFVITLLIVSVEVPRTFDQLLRAMSGFAAFAITFFLLAQLWYFHYQFFRRFNLQDHITIYLNMLLLFAVMFYTFPLKFLLSVLTAILVGAQFSGMPVGMVMHREQLPTLIAIYGLGFFVLFLLFALMYGHAYRQRRQLELDELETYETRYSAIVFLLVGAVGLLSIAVVYGTKHPQLAGFTYFLIAPLVIIGSRIRGRRRAELMAREAAKSA